MTTWPSSVSSMRSIFPRRRATPTSSSKPPSAASIRPPRASKSRRYPLTPAMSSPAWRRSRAPTQGGSKGSSPHRSSRRSSRAAGRRSASGSRLASSMTACTMVPMPMAVLVDPPDAWSMNQLSGERSKASSREGETGTRASGSVRSTTGSVVDGSRSPYHSAGSAPVTPSAARRARADAAARPRSRVASAARRAVRSPETTRPSSRSTASRCTTASSRRSAPTRPRSESG